MFDLLPFSSLLNFSLIHAIWAMFRCHWLCKVFILWMYILNIRHELDNITFGFCGSIWFEKKPDYFLGCLFCQQTVTLQDQSNVSSFIYPFSDVVSVPDFEASAMENWGLITYRETALLNRAGSTPEVSTANQAFVIAHEMGHQVCTLRLEKRLAPNSVTLNSQYHYFNLLM